MKKDNIDLKVLVFPKDKNPYQNLLYKEMDNARIEYLSEIIESDLFSGLFQIPFELFRKRIEGFTVLHLHWLNKFHTHSFNGVLSRTFFSIYIIFFILWIKVLGYKLIWTIHNVIPHEKITINDPFFTRFISKLSNALIIHSENTLNELKIVGAKTSHIHIIPIGNYISCYPNTVSRSEARIRLGIPEKLFIFSFFGMIRKYKGVENLLESFSELQKQHKNTGLIIAGKCEDQELQKIINRYKSKYENKIFTFIRYIPDDEVQLYFNASSIMVFPFNRITTSSSVMLSASFAKSMIYPLIGNLSELPQNIGFSYHSEENSLTKTMVKALANRNNLNLYNKNAFSYAKKMDWKKIARKTLVLYKNI